MGQFRLFSDFFIEKAGRLCDELMFGWKPTIDLSKIKDDITNSQKGYSFVTNPNNSLSEAYLELCNRACASRQDSLSRRGRWDWAAVFKYVKKEETFREILGWLMNLTGGQTARWTELLSLWCENGEFGGNGIFVYDALILYLIRHHKAKSSTNREFIVARFLPAEVGHLLYKYLVYVRRFIELLDRERGFSGQGSNGSSPLLFRAQTVQGSKPWQAGRFTAVLKDATSQVWRFPVHSQQLRQLCIGITEKHVRGTSTL